MPPQQPDRLLDLFDESFDFSAHGFSDPGSRRHSTMPGEVM
jgi:hypothetical protein